MDSHRRETLSIARVVLQSLAWRIILNHLFRSTRPFPFCRASAIVGGWRQAGAPPNDPLEMEPHPNDDAEATTWCVPIMFDVQSIPFGPFVRTNLCDIVTSPSTNAKYRFDSDIYPVSKKGKDELARLIKSEALKSSGLELCVVGGRKYTGADGTTYDFSLKCPCSIIYGSNGVRSADGALRYPSRYDKEKEEVIPQDVRDTSLHNDRRNDRSVESGGRSAPRQSNSARRMKASDRACPFRLPIYQDGTSYLMKPLQGSSLHCYHLPPPPRILTAVKPRVPIRLLPVEQRAFAKAMSTAHAGPSVNANIMSATTPYRISAGQFRNLAANSGDSSVSTATGKVQEVLKEHNARCLYLMQACGGNDTGRVLTEEVDGAGDVSSVVPSLGDEADEVNSYVNATRQQMQYEENQKVMVAFAWVLPFELLQFRLFPFVLHFDGTNDTNNEKRILFTVSGRDSDGDQFIVLRALIPNECAWMFKWLFSTALPTLLGTENLDRVLLAMTDGDSQETSQLDIALRTYMPTAVRGRCIWHIIDRGMVKHFPSSKPFADKGSFKSLGSNLKEWLWSWSQSTCETKEEFEVSKALLLEYLSSTQMSTALSHPVPQITTLAVEAIHNFIVRHVEPHEAYFLFHERNAMLTFETNSNSAHEGTNRAVKYAAASTNPQHSIGECTSVLCFQATKSASEKYDVVTKRQETTELTNNLPTAKELTPFGNRLLAQQWKQSKNYNICGPNEQVWLCKRVSDNVAPVRSLVPRFSRVRSVVLKQGVLYCSCGFFERVGLPCRHQLKVLCTVHGSEYKGVTKADVKVNWWKDYYYFGLAYPTSSESMNRVDKSKNDVSGPRLDAITFSVVDDCDGALQCESELDASHRCLNYANEGCQLALERFSTAVGQFTQEMVDYGVGHLDDEDDNEGGDIGDMADHISIGVSNVEFPPLDAHVPIENTPSWQMLIPYFKELIANTQSKERASKVRDVLVALTAEAKGETSTYRTTSSKGPVVSVCNDKTVKRSTHKTKYSYN